jgi:hypothetical protein
MLVYAIVIIASIATLAIIAVNTKITSDPAQDC